MKLLGLFLCKSEEEQLRLLSVCSYRLSNLSGRALPPAYLQHHPATSGESRSIQELEHCSSPDVLCGHGCPGFSVSFGRSKGRPAARMCLGKVLASALWGLPGKLPFSVTGQTQVGLQTEGPSGPRDLRGS